MTRQILAVWIVVLSASVVSAHPVSRNNHDRTIVVRLTATTLYVDYKLELDNETAFSDLPRSLTSTWKDIALIAPAYLDFFAPELANNLDATLDGQDVGLSCLEKRYENSGGHFTFEYRFVSKWSPTPGKAHAFQLFEGNFKMKSGRVYLNLVHNASIQVKDVVTPSPELQAKPDLDLAPGDEDRLRTVKAQFVIPAKGQQQPTSTPDRIEEPPPPLAPSVSRDPFFDRYFGMLMLIAFGFGAAHAFSPGHGKTLVAAYLVGERGTIWHAMFLGVVTTFTHTSIVLAYSTMAFFYGPKIAFSILFILQIVAGLFVAGLGLWLLSRRLSGRPDHFHFGAGHGHGHGAEEHGHSHGTAGKPDLGWRSLLGIGVAGGIIPCFEALVLAISASTSGRPELSLPLVLAFSAGLGGVLIVIGIGVVVMKDQIAAHVTKPGRIQQLIKLLPLISAIVVIGLGFWMCAEGFRGFGLKK